MCLNFFKKIEINDTPGKYTLEPVKYFSLKVGYNVPTFSNLSAISIWSRISHRAVLPKDKVTSNTNITNAGTYANSAFAQANTDFTNISISPSQTYGNSGYYPVITISANGRINAVSTQVVTDPSAIAFAIALG